MSYYTTQLRWICENLARENSIDWSSPTELCQKVAPLIFDFDYPIFDQNYKGVLETKFLRHFFMKEIAYETVGLWKLKLEDVLNMEMPYYNQLYKSELIEFNPLYDYEVGKTEDKTGNRKDNTVGEGSNTSVTDGSNSSNTEGSVNINSDATTAFQDTPQSGLSDIENLEYLTSANIDKSTTANTNKNTTTGTTKSNVTDTSKSTINTLNDYTEKITEKISGKSAGKSYSQMLNEFRDSMINVDQQLFNKIKSQLFMGIMGGEFFI